jgi:CHASE2 domain-containing sensor protein
MNSDIDTGSRQSTLVGKIWRAFIATMVVLAFGGILLRLGLVPDIETSTRDGQMRLNRVRPSKVVLVRITDADYHELFKDQSPLNADTLAAIIKEVARGNPKVIGVDLDTSAPGFADLPQMVGTPVQTVVAPAARIVWARDARIGPEGMLEPEAILGRNDREAVSGLSVIPEDKDGVVRNYVRVYQVRVGTQVVLEQSFPWAIVRKAGLRGEDDVANGPLGIRLARQRAGEPAANVEVAAGQLLNQRCSPCCKFVPAMDPAALKGLFEEKIVLVGGTYRAGRDVHSTPVGLLNGMDLIAQIIDTEIDGGGPPRMQWYAVMLVLLFENIGLVVIGHFWRPEERFATWFAVNVAVCVIASLACSRLSFKTYLGMVFFLPVFGVVLLLHLYADVQMWRNRAIGKIYSARTE